MTKRQLRSKIEDLQYKIADLREWLHKEKLESQRWRLKFEHQQELTEIYKEIATSKL